MGSYDTLTVFTGDIVKSSEMDAGQLDQLFAQMDQTATWVADRFGVSTWFDRHRGDGWQCAIAGTDMAVWALVLFWADLVGADSQSRVSLSVGAGDIPNDDFAAGHGASFLASGHGLETLSGSQILKIDPSCPREWKAALPVLSFVANGWTARQAQVMGHALRRMDPDLNVSAFARDLDLQRQTVQSHLKSAGYWEISETLFTLLDGRRGKLQAI